MQVSLKGWSNEGTVLRPVDVARCFASSNLVGSQLTLAMEICSLFEGGSPSLAKKRAQGVPRSEFGSSRSYFLWAQFIALFLKSSLKGDEDNRIREAKKKFLASETTCKRVNKRLRYFGVHTSRENPLYRVILSRARDLISRTLGNFSERTLEQILDWSRPGTGSAVGTRDAMRVTLPFKLGKETRLCVTREALPYARLLVEGSPAWLRLHADVDWTSIGGSAKADSLSASYSVPYELTQTNRVAFVPKDAVTMRTIAVEPHLNQCLQLGACEYMARRLKSVGINLQDQGRNQQGAREGALFWAELDPLITMDLSSASDTISIGLVERLLPSAWVGFLDDIRSRSYVLGGETHDYHKWSSMGNGYTFPLETLIFWSLARACASLCTSRDDCMVYGDDIIVRRGCAALLIEVLRYCGFSVNTDKSALFGPFRESCGEDWWGVDRVVPVYLRYMEQLRPTDIYRVLNTLDTSFERDVVVGTLLKAHRGSPILRGLKTADPSQCIWEPESKVDALVKGGYLRYNRDWQCWTQLVARFSPLKRKVTDHAAYAASLLGSRELGDSRGVLKSTLRRRGQWSLLRVAVS